LLTVLPPPSEIAVAPELIVALLLTTLPVPALNRGEGVAAPVPTGVAGWTMIVTPLVVVWKPLGAAVVQVTVVPAASARQSANAAVGDNTAPAPISEVPSIRHCFVVNGLIIAVPLFSITQGNAGTGR
jgi:hypothetical protein